MEGSSSTQPPDGTSDGTEPRPAKQVIIAPPKRSSQRRAVVAKKPEKRPLVVAPKKSPPTKHKPKRTTLPLYNPRADAPPLPVANAKEGSAVAKEEGLKQSPAPQVAPTTALLEPPVELETTASSAPAPALKNGSSAAVEWISRSSQVTSRTGVASGRNVSSDEEENPPSLSSGSNVSDEEENPELIQDSAVVLRGAGVSAADTPRSTTAEHGGARPTTTSAKTSTVVVMPEDEGEPGTSGEQGGVKQVKEPSRPQSAGEQESGNANDRSAEDAVIIPSATSTKTSDVVEPEEIPPVLRVLSTSESDEHVS